MLKLAVTILVVLVIELVNSSKYDAEQLVHICSEQEGVTDEDLAHWVRRSNPKSRVLKCLEACIAEKTGEFVDNKLNTDNLEEYIDRVFVNRKKNAIYKEIVNDCKSITDEDRCEMVEKVRDCMKVGAGKRGVREL